MNSLHESKLGNKKNYISSNQDIVSDEGNVVFNILKETKEKEIITLEDLEQLAKKTNLPKKKILIIDGSLSKSQEDSNNLKYSFRNEDENIISFINFGIYRLVGYLNSYNVPTNIVKLNRDYTQDMEFLDKIKNSDIIGISTLSTDIKESFDFCSYIKHNYPDKIIIGGAEHFAGDYKWILENKEKTGIDLCCTSQGEPTLLALSLDVPFNKIGSLAYQKDNQIIKNIKFPRLSEKSDYSVGKPVPAKLMDKKLMPMIMPEMAKYFTYCGNSQTQSGCVHACDFCTSNNFLGNGCTSTLQTAEQEIKALKENDIDFVFIRDAMLNSDKKHFEDFLKFMKEDINTGDKKMGWFAFMSARKQKELKKFKEMADAGCVMIGVGVEDVIGDRKNLKKGSDLEVAIDFIDEAKNYLLVRTLMILGLPEHYNFSREEIKHKILTFMKQHPQAIYRFNIRTPIVGTNDFENNHDLLEKDIRKDVKGFKDHDTIHSVIDPNKMYDKLDIPLEKRWIKNSQDRDILRTEIMKEYFQSKEFLIFLESMKKNPLFYNIINDYTNMRK